MKVKSLVIKNFIMKNRINSLITNPKKKSINIESQILISKKILSKKPVTKRLFFFKKKFLLVIQSNFNKSKPFISFVNFTREGF